MFFYLNVSKVSFIPVVTAEFSASVLFRNHSDMLICFLGN